MAEIKRIDKYTIEIDGKRLRANASQEERLRAMSPEQQEMFLRAMGADQC